MPGCLHLHACSQRSCSRTETSPTSPLRWYARSWPLANIGYHNIVNRCLLLATDSSRFRTLDAYMPPSNCPTIAEQKNRRRCRKQGCKDVISGREEGHLVGHTRYSTGGSSIRRLSLLRPTRPLTELAAFKTQQCWRSLIAANFSMFLVCFSFLSYDHEGRRHARVSHDSWRVWAFCFYDKG